MFRELLNTSRSLPWEVISGRLKRRLVDDLGLAADVAAWAVDSWGVALGLASAVNTPSATGQDLPGNLLRWQQSGEPSRWVAERSGEWNHNDWLALLSQLRKSTFWPMDPDKIGAVVEAARQEFLTTRQQAAQARLVALQQATVQVAQRPTSPVSPTPPTPPANPKPRQAHPLAQFINFISAAVDFVNAAFDFILKAGGIVTLIFLVLFFIWIYNSGPKLPSHFDQGTQLLDAGKNEEAIVALTKAIEQDPNSTSAYFKRGIAYARKKEHDKAIDDFTKAIKLKPDDAGAYCNRSLAYDEKKEYDKAIDDYTKAIELKPDDVRAYYNRGLAYDDKKEYRKAIEDYTKAIAIKPDGADAYYNRGLGHKRNNNWKAAITDFTKYINLEPSDADGYRQRAQAYRGRGDSGDDSLAVADMKKAEQLDSKQK